MPFLLFFLSSVGFFRFPALSYSEFDVVPENLFNIDHNFVKSYNVCANSLAIHPLASGFLLEASSLLWCKCYSVDYDLFF